MKTSYLALCCLLLSVGLIAQPITKPPSEEVYKVNRFVSSSIGLGGMLISAAGIESLRDKDRFTATELASLQPEDVPRFDQWALSRDLDKRESAEAASDIFFSGAVLLPFTLMFDKRIRKNALDIGLIYLEAQAFSSNFYAWSPLGPRFNNRVRPVAYYEEVDFGLRSTGNNRNSFFSGHANTTALGTFFFAKVLSDYNPQWNGRQRALLFGAAALPPLYVSWQRVRALKHFPSDTAMGFAVGAFFGIMTPQVHKNWAKKHRTQLSITGGYTASGGGAGFTLTF